MSKIKPVEIGADFRYNIFVKIYDFKRKGDEAFWMKK